MRSLRVGSIVSTAVVLASIAASTSFASPVMVSYHTEKGGVPGTLSAGLDVYTVHSTGAGQLAAPVFFASLLVGAGNDFTVYVDPSVAGAPWTATVPQYAGHPPGFWPAGLNLLAPVPFTATTVSGLNNLCTGGFGPVLYNNQFLMVRRGDCTFETKVTAIESLAGAGAIIADTNVGFGAPDIFLPDAPSVPVIVLSNARSSQLLPLITQTDYVLLDFAAHWEPDPAPVPEPGSLALMALGLSLVAVLRRKPTQPRSE